MNKVAWSLLGMLSAGEVGRLRGARVRRNAAVVSDMPGDGKGWRWMGKRCGCVEERNQSSHPYVAEVNDLESVSRGYH